MKPLLSNRFSVEASPPPADIEPAQLPFIAEVKSRLQSGEYRLENSVCPCGASEAAVISEVERYGLPLTAVVCAACGTVRFDPYLDKPSLEHFYKNFYQDMYGRATDVESYFLRQRSYGEKILSVVENSLKPPAWVFEVGCGSGGALDVFQARGYRVTGCDYSAELIEAGKRRGVENIHHGSLADLQTALGDVKADIIYLYHVFEHVIEPLAFLETCRDLLKPNARVIIVVPDVSRIGSFPYPAGDLLQFLHIAHKYNYSSEGMRALGDRAGYAVSDLHPDPNMRTPCSHMPELWVEFTVREVVAGSEVGKEMSANNGQGKRMLEYLRRTEKLYSMGLCRGQLLNRITSGKNTVERNLTRLSRVTPAKVVRKIKRT